MLWPTQLDGPMCNPFFTMIAEGRRRDTAPYRPPGRDVPSSGDQPMRVAFVLLAVIVAGVLYSHGALAGFAPGSLSHLLPLSLRAVAIVSFGLALGVITLLTVVSEGGFRKGELSTAVPSFFLFYAFFFGMVYWLFA
jgi:hypothetical protein